MGSNRMLIKTLSIVFLLTFLAPVAFTQSVGHGISKHTWAASNPRQCYDWFYDFIPVREDFGSCPDGNCECATQGRVALDGYTGHTDITRPGPTGFGLIQEENSTSCLQMNNVMLLLIPVCLQE